MLSADVVRLPCEYVMRRFLPFSGRVLTLCVCAQVLSSASSVQALMSEKSKCEGAMSGDAGVKEKWSFPTVGPVFSSPAVSKDGATIFVGSLGYVYALDA